MNTVGQAILSTVRGIMLLFAGVGLLYVCQIAGLVNPVIWGP